MAHIESIRLLRKNSSNNLNLLEEKPNIFLENINNIPKPPSRISTRKNSSRLLFDASSLLNSSIPDLKPEDEKDEKNEKDKNYSLSISNQSLNIDFTSYLHLIELEIISCKLEDIPKDIYNLLSLKKLILDKNLIRQIDFNISELTNITVLSLNDNDFDYFPETLCSLKNLEELYLECNRLKGMPNEIKNLSNLRIFSLRDNYIGELNENLFSLVNIEYLYLNTNKLTKISPSFAKLIGLKKLDLRNNKIQDEEYFNIPNDIRKITKIC